MKSTPSITELVCKQHPDAAAKLYQHCGAQLVGYGMRQWQLSEDDAWELCYKTLYRVLETAHRYTFVNEQKFNAFVYTVFLNYVRNAQRAKKAAGIVLTDLDEANTSSVAEEAPTENAALISLRSALDALADWERMLLLLRSQGVAYAEIARLTGKPESQLKVYYMRLRKRLQNQLTESSTTQPSGRNE